MLQVVLGLDAKSIASAFLVSLATMGKRLVRAKDKIRQAGIPFVFRNVRTFPTGSTPCWTQFTGRFAEGWTDAGGTDVARRDLTEEAIFWPGS